MVWEKFFGRGEPGAATLEKKQAPEKSETLFSNADSIKDLQELLAHAQEILGIKELKQLVSDTLSTPEARNIFGNTQNEFNGAMSETLVELK